MTTGFGGAKFQTDPIDIPNSSPEGTILWAEDVMIPGHLFFLDHSAERAAQAERDRWHEEAAAVGRTEQGEGRLKNGSPQKSLVNRSFPGENMSKLTFGMYNLHKLCLEFLRHIYLERTASQISVCLVLQEQQPGTYPHMFVAFERIYFWHPFGYMVAGFRNLEHESLVPIPQVPPPSIPSFKTSFLYLLVNPSASIYRSPDSRYNTG